MSNKPDFIQIASDDESILHQDTFSGFVMGCEHVWSSHVEPLQKENEKLKELQQVNYQLKRDIDDQNLKIERQADHIRVLGSERSELTYNIDVYKDELKTLQSEITQLRNEIRELKDEMRVQSEMHDPE